MLWAAISAVRAELKTRAWTTSPGTYARLVQHLAGGARPPYVVLDERMQTTHGHLSVSTMHLAKGLEFRKVLVMACDDEVLPLQSRIGAVGDDADLEEVYTTERHLLYVACTRAREDLMVTGVGAGSEFLEDLRG